MHETEAACGYNQLWTSRSFLWQGWPKEPEKTGPWLGIKCTDCIWKKWYLMHLDAPFSNCVMMPTASAKDCPEQSMKSTQSCPEFLWHRTGLQKRWTSLRSIFRFPWLAQGSKVSSGFQASSARKMLDKMQKAFGSSELSMSSTRFKKNTSA